MATDAKIYDIAVAYILKAMLGRDEWRKAFNRPASLDQIATEVLLNRVTRAVIGKAHPSLHGKLALEKGELVVASAFFSDESWYAFTTRRIISQFQGVQQSLDPSEGVRADWGNFKGYDFNKDWDEDTPPNHTAIPIEVAKITAVKSNAVLRFEFETWQAFTVPSMALQYWICKHPAIDKLMTPADYEAYRVTKR